MTSDHESGSNLIRALNAIAAELQRSARSEAEVYQLFCEQVMQFGLRGTVTLRDGAGGGLTVKAAAFPEEEIELLKEWLQIEAGTFSFTIPSLGILRDVLEEGVSIFLADNSEVIQGFPPGVQNSSLNKIQEDFVNQPVIFAPMRMDGEIRGYLNVIGSGLRLEDVPFVEAFAYQISIGLDKAGLISAMQEQISDREQAERALRQHAQELAGLHELLLDITGLNNIKDLLHKIVELAVKLLDAAGGALYLSEPEHERVRLHIELQGLPFQYVGMTLNYGEGAAGSVAQSGKPLIIDDYRTWPGRAVAFAQSGFLTVLTVPMIWQGKVSGVLQVFDNNEVRRITKKEQEFLSFFASQAAIALENARLLEGERAQLLLSRTLQEVGALVTSQLGLDELLENLLDLLGRVVNYDSVAIMLAREDGSFELSASRGFPDGETVEKTVQSLDPVSLEEEWRSHEVVIIPDTHTDARWVRYQETDYIRSWIAAPLQFKGRFIGSLNVDSRTPNAFDDQIGKTVLAFADQAAVAIETARLYEQAAVERMHLSLLYDIGRTLASSLDPDEILERAVSLTCQALDGVAGEAFLYLPEENRLSLRALFGRPDYVVADLDKVVLIRKGVGLVGWVAEHQQPVYLAEITDDPRWYSVPGLDEDVFSAISAPILLGGRLYGVMSVLHEKKSAFSTDHLDLLQAICREIGLALSNADRYQQIQHRLNELTLIQTLAQTFNKRLDLQALLDEVVTLLAQRLGFPIIRIYLVENEELVLRATHGSAHTRERFSIRDGFVGRVAETGVVGSIPAQSSPLDAQEVAPVFFKELAVPIFREKAVVGVLEIEADRPDQLTAHDQDFLLMLAGQISIALENAVLFERERRHAGELEFTVAKRTVELASLYELSQKIGYTLSFDDLLSLLLRHLCTALGCDLAIGYLFNDDTRLKYIVHARPLPADIEVLVEPVGEPAFWKDQQAQVSDDQIQFRAITAEEFNAGAPVVNKLDARIEAPIRIGKNQVGLLIAGSEGEQVFGEAQLRLLETFALQAANAIERISAILSAQQRSLEGLVEHLPVGVMLLDAEHRLLVANPMAKEMLAALNVQEIGGSIKRLGTYAIEDLIAHHDDFHPVEILLEGTPRQCYEAEARPMGKDGSYWVLTLRDTTQERENQARIQMQERLATVGQLAAGIAHDFNNIMAAILVYADLLASDPEISKGSRDRLDIIQQQVQRAASLIRQILDFSRRAVMEQSTLDLLPFVKELDKMLARVIPENIYIKLTYEPDAYYVNADPTRLQQVFINLALNARDAMPEGGKLHFDLGKYRLLPGEIAPIPDMLAGDWVTITVVDTGTGMSAEVLTHVFEPFFTTKPVGRGTGLGLAQVYGIVKQHDGYIDVSSQVGTGTTFTIYLPALSQVQWVEESLDSSNHYESLDETVLIVEDDHATRAALQALLERLNCHVLTAQDGLEALSQFELSNETITLVVSDIVMPQMGGLALYKALKESKPEVKMLFVTGHPLEGENQALLERGDVAWLQKPFSVREFTSAVQTLLET